MAQKIIKVTVKYIPNTFEQKGRVEKELTYPYKGLTSVYDLLSDIKKGDIPAIPTTVLKKHKVIINGKVIDVKDFKKTQLNDKDEVIITPEVEAVLGFAALGGLVGWGIGAGIGLGGMALFNAIMLGFSIGGIIGSIVFMPSFKVDADFNTPTYGWQGQRSYVSPENPIPIVYGQLRVPLRYINMYATNDIQYDAVWREVTPSSQYNSGFVNQFQITGSKIKIFLEPIVAVPQVLGSFFSYFVALAIESAGNLIPSAPQTERIRQLQYVSGGSYFTMLQNPRFLGYKVEYKLPSSETWTEYGYVFPTFNVWMVFPPLAFLMALMGESDYTLINPLIIELPEAGTYDIRCTLGGINVSGIPTSRKYWRSVHVFMPPSITDPDKTYLNLLGAVAEGECADIDASTIEIEGNPIGNYDSDTIDIYIRKGTNNDTPIPGFNEIHSYVNFVYNLNKQYDNATQRTAGTEIEAFAITLAFNGLYRMSETGKVFTWDVTYRVEWKLASASTWSASDKDEVTITMKQQTQFTKQYRKDHLPAGQYDIRVTRLSATPNFYNIGNMTWTQLDEIRYDDLAYPNLAKVAMRILASEKLSGSIPNITAIVKGRKVLQPKILNAGGTWLHYDEYYYDWTNQKYVEFSTENEAFWDEVTWVEDWTANPIWIMYDLWRTNRPGISDYIDGEIHTENLPAMANYSDSLVLTEEGGDTYEKRFRLDACIDAEQRATDLFRALASTFRAFVFQTGGKMKIVIDKEETVSQKFTMGNIVTKSGKTTFKSVFSSLKSSPNVIEVQYLDKSQNYQRNVVLFEDYEALEAGEPIRKQSLSLMLGITRTSQALRMAKYYLYIAKYCIRVSSFNALLDAVTAQCGDLISVQHDVTGWGYGGRTGSGCTSTKVVLDDSVTLAAGTTYEMIIRFRDDTIERRDISTAAGTHAFVNVSSAFSQIPAKYDIWEIVTKTLGEKKFKIIDVGRDSLEEVSITGLEYNASIYDDITGIMLPTPNYSLLRKNAPVTELQLSEAFSVLKDGSIENIINVYFNKPTYAILYGYANVYLSDNGGDTWEYKGETAGNTFTIMGGVYSDTDYMVAVASVTKEGEETSRNLWMTKSIHVTGKDLPPQDVSVFNVAQVGDRLELSWTAVSDVDIDYYEIRRGNNWDTGTQIARTKQTQYPVYNFPFGEQAYLIKARDTSGNYSVNAKEITIVVTEIPNRVNILDLYDVLTKGTMSGSAAYEWNEIDSERFRKCVLIGTLNTWDDAGVWDDGATWDYPVLTTPAYYTLPVQDIGFEAKIVVDMTLDILTEGDSAAHTIEERHSSDNITWTDWTELGTGYLTCRYVQLRIKLQTTDTDQNIRLFSVFMTVSAYKTTEYIANQSIAAGGTTINFTSEFHTDDLSVIVTPLDSHYVPYVTDITKTSCKVYLTSQWELDVNSDWMPVYDEQVAGSANIVVSGF